MSTNETGRRAEETALNYLLKQGLRLIERNYNCRMGEIDLIMRDKDCLAFVEVRSRTGKGFGGGVGSITQAKRRKIMKTALHYLGYKQLQDKIPLRFDVLSIDGTANIVTWIKDAFGLDY